MMRHLVRATKNQNMSTVVVIHDINTASAYADRLIALKDGEVVADGTPDEVVRPEVLEDIFEVDVEVVYVNGRPVAVPRA